MSDRTKGRRRKLWSTSAAVLLLLATSASGAHLYQPIPSDPMLEPWRWRVFPELRGLDLRCMAEGANAEMWFGTTHGVWRYDGLEWTSYGPDDGLGEGIESLCASKDEVMFAGGPWGISKFSRGKWRQLFPAANETFGAVRKLITTRDGTLWAATAWGLLRFGNSNLVLYTGNEGAARIKAQPLARSIQVQVLPSHVLDRLRPRYNSPQRSDFFELHEDSRGDLWIGTSEGEILRFRPPGPETGSEGDWTLYNEADGLVLSRRPVILGLADGSVWVVFFGNFGRAARFDGTNWKNVRLQDAGIPNDSTCLLQTRDGVLWLGCNGAVAANRDGDWTIYEAPNVPIPAVRTIVLQSSDGALWVGGQEAEVLRLDYQTGRWRKYQDLNFQWESPEGTQWFIDVDGGVVVRDDNQWIRYDVSDGLIDTPTVLIGTRQHGIWVAGSHDNTAATARLEGQRWTRHIHSELSWAIDWRAAFESSNGSLWFGASVDSANLGRIYYNGLMEFRDGQWIHHRPNNAASSNAPPAANHVITTNSLPAFSFHFYGIGESRDGRVWAGQTVISHFDGSRWNILPQSDDLRIGTVESIYSASSGDLWIGSRQRGVFRFNGNEWRRFHIKDGLIANAIRSITQTADGTVWAATDRGISQFDGRSWNPDALPPELNMAREGGSLKASPSGALWINHSSRSWNRRARPRAKPLDAAEREFWTVCYQLDRHAPQTALTLAPTEVAQPGNVTISWQGSDPWGETAPSHLQFSYRLDGGPWSPYTTRQMHSFMSLPSGQHRFEVRARDHDFNVDSTPAAFEFVVTPPVWQQAWFISLVSGLLAVIAFQAIRLYRRAGRLRATNRSLEAEIEERKRIEARMEETHKQLLAASRQAGMAEVATNVLHNVGNVLNSLNVSADLVTRRIENSRGKDLQKVSGLVAEYTREGNALAGNVKARMLPQYLDLLASHMAEEQQSALNELRSLQDNVTHIKNIIAMQQSYSRLAGFTETVPITEVIEDALRLNQTSLERSDIRLIRQFDARATVTIEKHKVLQILVNLIRNAKHACSEVPRPDKRIIVRTGKKDEHTLLIEVRDNGIGIPAENMVKIFGQGFTTRKDGHGFGLHSSANAARELGGNLRAHSDGPGKGACFTLELPIRQPQTD